jgi:hypothetical protein
MKEKKHAWTFKGGIITDNHMGFLKEVQKLASKYSEKNGLDFWLEMSRG